MGGRQRWSSKSWKHRFQYGRHTYSRNASGRKIMCANCVLQNRRSETNQHSGRQTMDNIAVIHKFEEGGLKGASCAQLVPCIFASPKRGCTAVVQKLETKVLTKRKHTFEQSGRRERHRRTLCLAEPHVRHMQHNCRQRVGNKCVIHDGAHIGDESTEGTPDEHIVSGCISGPKKAR